MANLYRMIFRANSLQKMIDSVTPFLQVPKGFKKSCKGAVACARMQVLKRVPGLKRLDGVPVEAEEREAAAAAISAASGAT